jgi:hypothetical protein
VSEAQEHPQGPDSPDETRADPEQPTNEPRDNPEVDEERVEEAEEEFDEVSGN